MRRELREEGSTLVVVMMLVVLLGGWAVAFQSLTSHHDRAARIKLACEYSQRCAESGIAYLLGECRNNPDYFSENPAPHKERTLGNTAFVLESAIQFGSDWDLIVTGLCDGVRSSIAVTVGDHAVPIPAGLQLTGTGDPNDTAVELSPDVVIGGYDSLYESFDPTSPGDALIRVDGSLQMSDKATARGNVELAGTLSGSSAGLSGTLTENATLSEPEGIDPLVAAKFSDSKGSNDNANLAAIFGSYWTPIAGAENYGDLIIPKSGTYVIPPGVYRFRKLELTSSAEVIFDTSTGPSTLVFAGPTKGKVAPITLNSASKILVDAGGTRNGLMTVLGPGTGVDLASSSVFGQEVTESDSGGYHQMVSLSDPSWSGDFTLNSSSSFYGRLYAPAHDLVLNGDSGWYGSAMARSASLSTGAFFAADNDSLGTRVRVPGTMGILAQWPIHESAP